MVGCGNGGGLAAPRGGLLRQSEPLERQPDWANPPAEALNYQADPLRAAADSAAQALIATALIATGAVPSQHPAGETLPLSQVTVDMLPPMPDLHAPKGLVHVTLSPLRVTGKDSAAGAAHEPSQVWHGESEDRGPP